MVFDSFPTNEHFSLKCNNLLIVRQNQISASALFCMYVDSYFLAVRDVNERFLFFSSPSRNQVNTPQSKMVIFPFKYGKCKHKNIYTSVKLLSQREYTITKWKALAPLHPKGSCINSIILIPAMGSPLLQWSFFILRWLLKVQYLLLIQTYRTA